MFTSICPWNFREDRAQLIKCSYMYKVPASNPTTEDIQKFPTMNVGDLISPFNIFSLCY